MKKLQYYIEQLKAEVLYLPKNLGYLFSQKRKAIYVGCTGQGNLGDDAVLEATQQMLSGEFHLYEIAYTKPSSGKFLRKLIVKHPDYIILGGGTIIRKGADESYLSILKRQRFLYPKAKLATLGSGVSEPDFANYIGFPIDIENWKFFLKECSFLSVRGKRSKMLLESWSLDTTINVLHDPAIWFARDTYSQKAQKKRIGLNFADIGSRIFGKNQDALSLFAFNLTDRLLKNGWEVYLYPTTKSDLNFMLETSNLKSFEGIHIYSNYTNLEASLEFLESLDVFIGQRLHSVIFAANVSTPFIALAYEPKTADFLETLGMENYSVRVDNLEEGNFFDKITQLYTNITTEQEQLHSLMKKAKKEQKSCLEMFLNILE